MWKIKDDAKLEDLEKFGYRLGQDDGCDENDWKELLKVLKESDACENS